MSRRLIFTLIGVAAVIGLSVLIKNLAVQLLTQPAADAADTFLSSLQSDDYSTAFLLLDDTMQQNLVDSQGLAVWANSSDVRPSSWSFTSRTIVGRDVEILGSAFFPNRGNLSLMLYLTRNAAGEWKVSRLRFG